MGTATVESMSIEWVAVNDGFGSVVECYNPKS